MTDTSSRTHEREARARYHRRSEAVIALAIATIVTGASWLYVSITPGVGVCHDYSNPGSTLSSAALWAAGHGFSRADPRLIPGLNDFLNGDTPRWDASKVPPTLLPVLESSKFFGDRLYMFYAVGIAWRVFGISWTSLSILMAFVYGLTGALCYGIFRLGMGRVASVAGTLLFLISPAVLFWLPSMRDFFRAPPILAAVLMCGYLASRRTGPRALLLLAAVSGAATGIGFGFRQDSVICLPPALLTLLFLAHGDVRHSVRLRLGAVALLLAAFVISAWPVIKDAGDSGGNNAFYLLQGFSDSSRSQLDMKQASYVPFSSNGDFLVHAGISFFDDVLNRADRESRQLKMLGARAWFVRAAIVEAPHDFLGACMYLGMAAWLGTRDLPARDMDIWTIPFELVGRRMMCELVETFPADVLSRWYSAVLRSLRGLQGEAFQTYYAARKNPVLDSLLAFQKPLTVHLDRWGVCYGLAVLLILNARSFRLGAIWILVLLYFCGYAGISFQVRHAFHLQLAALWALCFLLEKTLSTIGQALNTSSRLHFFQQLARPGEWVSACAKRILGLSACALLLLLAPFSAACAYQHHAVEALLNRYMNADLESLPWQAQAENIAEPKAIPVFENAASPSHEWLWNLMGFFPRPYIGIRTEYMAADLEIPNRFSDSIMIVYRDPASNMDFWHRIGLRDEETPSTYRYFFPVYDFSPDFRENNRGVFSSFRGLKLPDGVKLKGLYRVRNRQDFQMPMNVWIPPDRRSFKWRQGICPCGIF